MMRIVSMFTFRVFEWVGLHARACLYLLLPPVRVSPTLSTAFFAEPFGLVDSPLVLEVSVSGQRASCFFHATFCLVDVRVVWALLGRVKVQGSGRV